MVGLGRYAYVVCHKRHRIMKNHTAIGWGDLVLQYEDTPIWRSEQDGKRLLVVGRFVDSENDKRAEGEIVDELVDNNEIDGLLENIGRLAGRFIVIYLVRGQLFVIPDATASVPVNYSIKGDLYISSNAKIIADINGWCESHASREIRAKGDATQALPYDMTPYGQIKKVPPNHVLRCETRIATRFYPRKRDDPVSVDAAAEVSYKLLKNIVTGYHRRSQLALPLTSGRDSRTILSVCRDIISEVPTFTFLHSGYSENTADIVIPGEMARALGFRHTVLIHQPIPEDVWCCCKRVLGSQVKPTEVQNAWTYCMSEIGNRTRLVGSVSPLAKSVFGKALPELLATPSYLVTKTHNYSCENRRQVSRWVKETQRQTKGSKVSKFDLFYWEHREGNWAAGSLMNSDLLSDSISPYNCRQLIETWLRVPRRERMGGEIHERVIQLAWPELLNWPFNPGGRYTLFSRNSLLFYIATRGKYFLERFKYLDNQL